MLLMNAGKNVHTFGDIGGDTETENFEAVVVMYTTDYDANIIIATNRSEVINYLDSVNYENFEAFEQLSKLMNTKSEYNNEIERNDYNEDGGFTLGNLE